jgi:hypothetical protein
LRQYDACNDERLLHRQPKQVVLMPNHARRHTLFFMVLIVAPLCMHPWVAATDFGHRRGLSSASLPGSCVPRRPRCWSPASIGQVGSCASITAHNCCRNWLVQQTDESDSDKPEALRVSGKPYVQMDHVLQFNLDAPRRSWIRLCGERHPIATCSAALMQILLVSGPCATGTSCTTLGNRLRDASSASMSSVREIREEG